MQVFRQLMRERQDEQGVSNSSEIYLGDKSSAQYVDFEQFKKVLVRIATLVVAEQGAE